VNKMEQINKIQYKIINKKWSFQLLVILYTKQKLSYKTIKTVLQIPNSTLALRLEELVKYKYLQKYIYGSVSKPHYTEYEITQVGLDYINNLFNFEKI